MRKDKYRILNALFSIEDVLELKGTGSNIKCPFHGHDRKPSAHVYPGVNKLWCFTEGRFYSVTDCAKIMGKSIDEMYSDLVEKYGGEENLIAEFKEVELKPKRENMKLDEAETISDFFDRYFYEGK